MSADSDNFFIVTGGPGSGKSALIEALHQRGYACSFEAGRGIIQDQVAIEGRALPWHDRLLFAELMLSWDMRSYHLAQNAKAPVFFDRAVPDTLGYLRLLRLPAPAHMRKAADVFRYNRKVFIAPPWEQIFNKIRNASRSSMKPSAPTLRWSKPTNRWTTNCWNCREPGSKSVAISS